MGPTDQTVITSIFAKIAAVGLTSAAMAGCATNGNRYTIPRSEEMPAVAQDSEVTFRLISWKRDHSAKFGIYNRSKVGVAIISNYFNDSPTGELAEFSPFVETYERIIGGKWRPIHQGHDTVPYPFYLRAGARGTFIAYKMPFEGLPKGSICRVRSGSCVSQPFQWPGD